VIQNHDTTKDKDLELIAICYHSFYSYQHHDVGYTTSMAHHLTILVLLFRKPSVNIIPIMLSVCCSKQLLSERPCRGPMDMMGDTVLDG